jgi:endonuclease
MSEYSKIKELVIETCMNEEAFPSYEKLTSLVLKYFPTSKWQKTHYAWYKSKIKRGEISVPGFDPDIQINNTSDEAENEVQETIEASLSLERDLHSYLAKRVNEIENGLVLVEKGSEYPTDVGRIDLLAKDKQGNNVVIELKVGKAKDSALGQLLGYMGCIASSSTVHIQTRGILVASEFEQRVVYAARGLPNVKLIKYRVSFELQEIT